MGERTHCSSYLLMFGFHIPEDVSLADNGCIFSIVSDWRDTTDLCVFNWNGCQAIVKALFVVMALPES